MLCAKCKKNQATKSYIDPKRDKKLAEYYCLDCYARLFESVGKAEIVSPACPYCGVTADEVKKRNIVGCAMCYDALQDVLMPIVSKFQGENTHTGKSPVGDRGENIRRRCYELKSIADKLNADGDFDGARAYIERLSALQNGKEEDYVWRKHHRLFKRS